MGFEAIAHPHHDGSLLGDRRIRSGAESRHVFDRTREAINPEKTVVQCRSGVLGVRTGGRARGSQCNQRLAVTACQRIKPRGGESLGRDIGYLGQFPFGGAATPAVGSIVPKSPSSIP